MKKMENGKIYKLQKKMKNEQLTFKRKMKSSQEYKIYKNNN